MSKQAREFLVTKMIGTGNLDLWVASTNHEFIEKQFHQEKFIVIEKQVCDELKAKLDILRRYHAGDGTITREKVMEVLGDE